MDEITFTIRISEPEPGQCRVSMSGRGQGSNFLFGLAEGMKDAISDYWNAVHQKAGNGIHVERVGENHGKERN